MKQQPNAGGRYYRVNGALVPEGSQPSSAVKSTRRKSAAAFAGETATDAPSQADAPFAGGDHNTNSNEVTE